MSENTVSHILSAARLLFQQGDVIEVRIPKAQRFRVISGYFDDFQVMAEAVSALDREAYAGVYWTLNPVDPALLARSENKVRRYAGANETTADKYIVRRRLFLVDCDPERPPEISSTNEEHAAAIEKIERIHGALLDEGWPEALRADSGNGGHLVYGVDLPNDKETAELLQRCLQALAIRFDDPEHAKPNIKVDKSTFNASRISKIYGTMARKGDHTSDRPHRVSRVLHVPALLTPVPPELLLALAAQAPVKQRSPHVSPKWRGTPRTTRGAQPLPFDLRQFLNSHGIRYRDPVPYDGGSKYTLEECPFDSSHQGKDAAVFDRPDGLGFKCFHNSCSDRGWREFRELFEPNAYQRGVSGRHAATQHPAHPADGAEDAEPEFGPDEEAISVEDVRAAVAEAIERNNLDDALVLIPEIAKLPTLAVLRIKTALTEKFKRKFSASGFEQAIREERRRGLAGFRREEAGLPTIIVNNRPMRDVAADSLDALRAANDPPFLFVRSGQMVYVEMDERQRPSIQAVSKAHLRGRLDRAANYTQRGVKSDASVPPPLEVVEDVLALPTAQWGVPPLEFVVEVPTLRPDGTILSAPGYDPISRMLYAPAPGFRMEPIPDFVNGEHLKEAIALIDEAIGDFPYAEEKTEAGATPLSNPNRANVFGLLLTPIVRPAIAGVVPLALIDAPQAGTGKSLLVDLFSIIATGRAAAMMPFPRNEEEMQKSVGSTLLAGGALVCFDNIEGILQSPTLALVLTAKDYQCRILGVSENMIVPNRATWVATGNNIRPSGDMPRRCYHIRLDAKKSRPYQGRKFKHENLLDWAQEMRPRLLWSLLIIARAWYQRKVKVPIADVWGSFESWHRTIAGILRSASVDGFLANLQTFLNEADDMALQWEAFLDEIQLVYDTAWFTVGKIVLEVRQGTPLAPARFTVPDSLADVDRKKEGGLERALGKSFAKRLGTRFGERELHLERRIDKHTKQAEWRVLVGVPATEADKQAPPAPKHSDA